MVDILRNENNHLRIRTRAPRLAPAEVLQLHKERDILSREATTDTLTGFLNENGAREELLARFADISRNHEHAFGVVIVDLKNFAFLNDNLGHLAGDRILQMISEKMRFNARSGDAFWRIGGDEFALFLSVKSKQELERLIFSKRHERSGTGELPGWLDTVNDQIKHEISSYVKGTRLEGIDMYDAGQLRAGTLFIDTSWINMQYEEVDFIESVLNSVKGELQRIKDNDDSTPALKGLKI
jgi:GGDEF domain-containing protein